MTRSTFATTRSAGSWTFFTVPSLQLVEAGPMSSWPRSLVERQYPSPLQDGSSGPGRFPSSAASPAGLELQPFGHHLAADGSRLAGPGAAALHDDGHRDRRRRAVLGRCEADEPGVRGEVPASAAPFRSCRRSTRRSPRRAGPRQPRRRSCRWDPRPRPPSPSVPAPRFPRRRRAARRRDSSAAGRSPPDPWPGWRHAPGWH